MQGAKKIVSVLLALLILGAWALAYPVEAREYRGGDFTADAALAEKMDRVISGRAKLFNNSDALFGVGDSIDAGKRYTWGTYDTWGYGCLAYAQAVYYYLFGESCVNPEASLEYSYVALENKALLEYDDLKQAGVGFGAYVRTTGNRDGSFSSWNGHSLLILTYDEDTITILEGNADYDGLIEISTMSWKTFQTQRMTNQGRRLCFVIQPNATKGMALAADTTGAPKVSVGAGRLPDRPAGDFDGNGVVDAGDARVALRAAVGLEDLPQDSVGFRALDVNGDGSISSVDARILLRKAVGLE